MLDAFKSLLKKPEFPDSDEPDFLAVKNSDSEDREETAGPPHDNLAEEQPVSAEDIDDFPPERKTWPRIIAGAAVCVGVAFLGGYWYTSSRDPIPAQIPQGDILASLTATPTAAPSLDEKIAPPKTPSEATNTIAAKTPAPPATTTSSPAPPAVAKPEPSVKQPTAASETLVTTESSGAFGVNPFIDLSVLHSVDAATAASGVGLPPIWGNGNRALPEVPRPAVSPDLLPAPGEIRTPPAPVGASASPPVMGGLIKKSNGEFFAIMGDGTVLSEGDTYKGDRRVTYIGGDGITFDDGNTVSFGQNK